MTSNSEQFCQACIAGDVSAVHRMLQEDPALANAFGMVRDDHREFMKRQDAEDGWTALHLAAHYGQLRIVELLINSGADLNRLADNAEGNTPLMAAVAGGQLPIIKLLVESGADPQKTDARGDHNAVKLAQEENKPEIASYFGGLLDKLKNRLHATWSAGDFGLIAKSYEIGAAEFISRLTIAPGQHLLDVACGTGNLAIPAAKAGATVTGVDIAENLVMQARQWAEAEQLQITFDVGDAEMLPYANESFDVVVSMFGAMFAPRPDVVSGELLRVTRPGGKIAMANWTPNGFVGQMFKTIATLVPPANMPSPLLWGEEPTVAKRLGAGTVDLQTQTRTISFRFGLSPVEVVEFWRLYYGPTQQAFGALASEPEKQAVLQEKLITLWSNHNQAAAGSTLVESEYLEVTAIRA